MDRGRSITHDLSDHHSPTRGSSDTASCLLSVVDYGKCWQWKIKCCRQRSTVSFVCFLNDPAALIWILSAYFTASLSKSCHVITTSLKVKMYILNLQRVNIFQNRKAWTSQYTVLVCFFHWRAPQWILSCLRTDAVRATVSETQIDSCLLLSRSPFILLFSQKQAKKISGGHHDQMW